MRRSASQFLCSVLPLLLVVIVRPDPFLGRLADVAVTARPAQMSSLAADGRVLAPEATVHCRSQSRTEPLDPPVTSALPRRDSSLAAEHFRLNTSPGAESRISWLGATFMRRFAVKIEADPSNSALRIHRLSRSAGDRQIIEELAGRHEIKLAELWCLLKLQPNGEDGPLLTNAAPNLFYVRDAAGFLGVVDAIWGGAGWEIGASSVDDDQRRWPSEARVISR